MERGKQEIGPADVGNLEDILGADSVEIVGNTDEAVPFDLPLDPSIQKAQTKACIQSDSHMLFTESGRCKTCGGL